MYRRSLLLWSLLPVALWASLASSTQAPAPGRSWQAKGAAFYEELLLTAEIIETAPVGIGGLRPGRVYLRRGSDRVEAVFKSVVPGLRRGFWESHQAEVAAYEVDKLLGLGMVPPTILRPVVEKSGSLQLWIDDCRNWEGSFEDSPSAAWRESLYRMGMFDDLIGNPDRPGNILIDPAGNMILIDHSRAFITDKQLSQSPPTQFDRNLVAKMRALDKRRLEQVVGRLLSGEQINAVLARRDLLLAHLDRLIQEKGEAAVLF